MDGGNTMTDTEKTQPTAVSGPDTAPASAATPRKVGVARFFELMGRDLWPFYKASILCCVGFVPGFLAVFFGILSGAVWISLLGGALGGMIAAPFLCGMFDTVLRALRDEPGYWWHTYRNAWKQNWRDALAPGALAGAALGLWSWVLTALPDMTDVPTSVWVCMIVSGAVLVGFFTYVFAQLVLVSLPLPKLLKNSGLFFLGFFPRTLAATLVQCVYWVPVLMYMPYTLPVLLVTGFWLPVTIGLQVLYPGLDRAFALESTIRQRRDEELPQIMAQRDDQDET